MIFSEIMIDKKEFQKEFNTDFDSYFAVEKEHLQRCAGDGLVELRRDKIIVSDLGKIFVRNICMGFDWYLRQQNSHKRFSRTV